MLIGIPTQINTSYYSTVYEVKTPTYQGGEFVYSALQNIKDNNRISNVFQTLEQRFQSLVSTWKKNTINYSSITQIISEASYLQIIALGKNAIPLILNEMQKEPGYWFPALTALTGGVNPIKVEHRGDLVEMTRDWLSWARDNGYYVA